MDTLREHPDDISEKAAGNDVEACLEALIAAFDAAIVRDAETLETLDLALQEASVSAWNASLHTVPVIGPEGEVTYPD